MYTLLINAAKWKCSLYYSLYILSFCTSIYFCILLSNLACTCRHIFSTCMIISFFLNIYFLYFFTIYRVHMDPYPPIHWRRYALEENNKVFICISYYFIISLRLCYNCISQKILIHMWYWTTRVPSKPLLLAYWSIADQFPDHVTFMSIDNKDHAIR
jgi:hypothetical protein